MNVVLIRVVGGVPGERAWLREGQVMTVGQSNWADLSFAEDLDLAAVQFVVELKGGACRVRNLAPGQRPLFVNGTAVIEYVLRDQDTIQAANSQFLVRIEGPIAGVAEAETPRTTTLRVARSVTPAQAGVLRVLAARPHWSRVVDALIGERSAALLANFQRARALRPPELSDDQDLFQHAPPEIRATDSLHLLPLDASRSLLTLARELGSRDAGVLIIANGTIEELAAHHKLYWAWFARPSLLAFQLAQGTAHLAAKLLHGLHAAVAMPATGDDVVLYCHANDASTLQQTLESLEVPVIEAS